jgi:hypothetical protein
MSSTPLLIDDSNLSKAWGRIFLHVLEHPGKTVSPLIVSISGFVGGQVPEDAALRKAMDAALRATGHQGVQTVANTIFPESLWHWACGDRQKLFNTYIAHFPRYQALAKRLNRRGLYFERLIRWQKEGTDNNNQLDMIIRKYESNHSIRRSALQASIFDPLRDHIPDAQLGFPCLQQISFVPNHNNLVMNAFYAKQCLFQKAYGNYLGLCRLALFMAGQMKLNLDRVNCFVGLEELEDVAKSDSAIQDLKGAAEALCAPVSLVHQ